MTLYSLTDPGFLADPAPVLARMRAEGPLVRTRMPMIGSFWITTTDAAARALLKDTETFHRDPQPITGKSFSRTFWWLPRSMHPLLKSLIVRDDPEHRRLRHLVELAFARASIAAMRPSIEAEADQLLAALPRTGEVDIVTAYTRELPFRVICSLLGVPEDIRPALTRNVAPLSHATHPLRAFYAMTRLKHVMRLFQAEFDAVRSAPRRGLISELVAARDGQDALSDDELMAMVFMLFLAGHETTVHLLNGAILTLAEAPELKVHLRDHPEKRPLLIEEFMRHLSPVMMSKAHFAARDTEFMGQKLKKGELVAACLIAANHDPDRVDDPEALIPDRRPNAHLGFGFGPHVCLGMQLARMEAEVALTQLVARFPDFALAGPRPAYLKRPGLRGPARLNLRLSPDRTAPPAS